MFAPEIIRPSNDPGRFVMNRYDDQKVDQELQNHDDDFGRVGENKANTDKLSLH